MIGGTGSINLSAAAERVVGSTGHTLVHEANHTIRGAGSLGANLIDITNRGSITADDALGTLTVDPRLTLNNDGGTLSASAGGTLSLGIGTYSSENGGAVVVGDGSTVALAGATVESTPFNADDQDGDLANNVFRVTTNSTISDVTNNAVISIANARTLTVGGGGLVNNGTVTLDTAGATTSFLVNGDAEDTTTTISGTGSIELSAAAERIVGSTGHTLVHEANHTIRGAGSVGVNLIDIINRGSITADDALGTLTVDPRLTLNNDGGTLSASAGGTLSLGIGTYSSENGGAVVVGDGSTVELAGATVESTPFNVDDQDGDLANNVLRVTTNSTISDVTNNAVISIANARTLTVGGGGLVNNGTVTLDTTGATTSFLVTGDAEDTTATISGTGSIELSAAAERIVGSSNHTLVNETGHTIRGAGSIGANLIDIINRGSITADIDSATAEN